MSSFDTHFSDGGRGCAELPSTARAGGRKEVDVVFDWYGAARQQAPGVPASGWTALEWELWSAQRNRPPVARRPRADAPTVSVPGDGPAHVLASGDPPRPVALTALLASGASLPADATGPVPAARLAHLLGGLSALPRLGSVLDPFVVTMDVSGVPQGLWELGGVLPPAGPRTAGVRLVPVRAPAHWLLRVARRLTPVGFGEGVAPVLVLWRVTWPDILDRYLPGGLLDVHRDLGAAHLAADLLAREAPLVGAPTRALPTAADLRDLDWPTDRLGVVGGFAVGVGRRRRAGPPAGRL